MFLRLISVTYCVLSNHVCYQTDGGYFHHRGGHTKQHCDQIDFKMGEVFTLATSEWNPWSGNYAEHNTD